MDLRECAEKIVQQMSVAEKISQLMDESVAIPRLDIPEYNWWNEALHGVARCGLATSFPQAIGLAAAFDTELVHEVAEAISDEARAKYNQFRKLNDHGRYKGLTIWSPTINIFRDPRWGRGHETYGEDPYLTSELAVAYVQGLQGDTDYPYRKCDATLKHLAAHSGPEAGRGSFNSVVGAKDLFETYLYAFERCIKKAEPSAVMSAYNALNGVPASCNEELLGEILRKRFGFDGYVVSDCGAICGISDGHKYCETKYEAAALAVKAGCDLNCGNAYSSLTVAYDAGLLTEADLDRALVRLIYARLRLGLPMAGIRPQENKYDSIPYEVVESKKNKALALKAAEEGIVLLGNNGILPLGNDLNIAVIGCNANERKAFLANYNGTPSSVSTIPQEIAAHNRGETKYSLGSTHTSMSEYSTLNDALVLAQWSDVVVYCVGLTPRMEGEAGDAYNSDAGGDKPSLALPKVQYEVFDALVKTGKPVIVVNITGSCVQLSPFCGRAAAILQCFYPGQMAAEAIANILFGTACPGGKLPVTFYASDSDLPPFEDYSMENRTYRYFGGKPLFPFGFGLSYTTFRYDDCRLVGDKVCFNVTNTGERNGQEVWQLYVRSFEQGQPRKSLKSFGRISVLPGETVRVEVPLTEEMFRLYDENGDTFFSEGEYELQVGSSSEDIHGTLRYSPAPKGRAAGFGLYKIASAAKMSAEAAE